MTMFNTAALKRVPKWAWYASAGVLGGATLIYIVRHRQAATAADSASQTNADSTGAVSPASAMPGIVVVPDQSAANTSQLQDALQPVGDLSQTYLAAISDLQTQEQSFLETVIGLIGSGGGSASTGSTGDTGGTVTVPSPNPAPSSPAPVATNPCPGMAKGGSAGHCHPAGAVCHQQLKCDSNSNGHYCVEKFKFADGHANCYSTYSSGKLAGHCVGPYGC